jgi:hypothetical protein
MKKLAIGCLLALVVGGVAAAGGAYYLYYRVKSTVSQFAELGKIPQIEAGVRIQTPFLVPTTGDLTQSQVDRFVQVQTKVRERLGRNFEDLQRKYKTLADKKEATAADLPQLIAAYRDLAASWLDAKRAQVEALNEAGLSLSEYRWIRSESYRALNVPFVDIDFGKIAEEIKNGKQPSGEILVGGAFTGPAPAGNAKLVERYRKLLEDNMPMAAFGL